MKTNRTLYHNSVKLLYLDVIKNSMAKNVYGEQFVKHTDWRALPLGEVYPHPDEVVSLR